MRPLPSASTVIGLFVVALALGVGAGACAPADSGPGVREEPSGGVEAPPLERFEVASDGHPMTVWARIPREPRAVILLLHGRTWSSLPDFDLRTPEGSLSLMEALAARGIAAYALDARGYGATPRDETGWLNPDRMARDVQQVLEWLGGRHPDRAPPALLGWSFGSTTAHLAVQRRPELVSGVALYGYWKHPGRTTRIADEPDEPPRTPTTETGARSDFITPGSISEGAVEAFVAAALAADPVRADIRRTHEFDALSPDSLTVPTLVLQGEFDPIAPAEVQAALFSGLGTGHKAWVVLPGCDHAAHLERCMPRFVRTLAGFVLEVSEGR